MKASRAAKNWQLSSAVIAVIEKACFFPIRTGADRVFSSIYDRL